MNKKELVFIVSLPKKEVLADKLLKQFQELIGDRGGVLLCNKHSKKVFLTEKERTIVLKTFVPNLATPSCAAKFISATLEFNGLKIKPKDLIFSP